LAYASAYSPAPQVFYHATLVTEGHSATTERVLSTIEFLLEMLEAAKVAFAEDSYMRPSINASWSKLDKYYSLTERSPAYIAAIVLTPSQKWTWIEDNWEKEWISITKAQLQEFWNTQYKPIQRAVLPTRKGYDIGVRDELRTSSLYVRYVYMKEDIQRVDSN
jgi:hypothetical protein